MSGLCLTLLLAGEAPGRKLQSHPIDFDGGRDLVADQPRGRRFPTRVRQKPGAGGTCALYVDDKKVAEGSIPKTQPYAFSADEGVDVGLDGETAVSNDYRPETSRFTGRIVKVTIDVKPVSMGAGGKKLIEDRKAAAEAAE